MSVSAVLGTASAAPQAETPAPARLAIYYGIPSLVNGASGDIERAVRVFAEYDVIVFGDGLQYEAPAPGARSAGRAEHRRTRALIRQLTTLRRDIQVFGYLPLGDTQALPMTTLLAGVRHWHSMGVRGVFLDEAGYDFGVTRIRQRAVVEAIHRAGGRAFVNAFNPDDVLSDEAAPLNARGGGNPSGLASPLRAGDLFLLESFVVRNGDVEPADAWFERSRKAAAHRERTGIRVMTVTTAARHRPFERPLCEMAWWAATLWAFDGFGWGEPDFAAPSSALPSRTCGRAGAVVGRYVSGVQRDGVRFVRRSEHGTVEVDFGRRLGRMQRSGRSLMPPVRLPQSSPAPHPDRTSARMCRDAPAESGPA
jgi:hypothetical protein